jgi:hypothetical protein
VDAVSAALLQFPYQRRGQVVAIAGGTSDADLRRAADDLRPAGAS